MTITVRAIKSDEWAQYANKRTSNGRSSQFDGLIELVKKNGGAVIEHVETSAQAKNIQSSLAAVGRRAGFPLTSSYNVEHKMLLVIRKPVTAD